MDEWREEESRFVGVWVACWEWCMRGREDVQRGGGGGGAGHCAREPWNKLQRRWVSRIALTFSPLEPQGQDKR